MSDNGYYVNFVRNVTLSQHAHRDCCFISQSRETNSLAAFQKFHLPAKGFFVPTGLAGRRFVYHNLKMICKSWGHSNLKAVLGTSPTLEQDDHRTVEIS